MSDSTGDSLVGLPNGSRLPNTSSLDLLVRRSIRLGGTTGGIYLDIRNLLNRRNIVAVRRDTGEPSADEVAIQRMAEAAYAANPDPIPFESVTVPGRRGSQRRRIRGGARGAVSDVSSRPRATTRSRSSPTGRRGWRGWGWSCCSESQILLHQRLVDSHSGLGALGRGHDDELRLLRRIPRDVESGHVGGLALAGVDRPLLGEAAAQTLGQRAPLPLAVADEEGAPGDRVAAGEHDALEQPEPPLEPEYRLVPHLRRPPRPVEPSLPGEARSPRCTTARRPTRRSGSARGQAPARPHRTRPAAGRATPRRRNRDSGAR